MKKRPSVYARLCWVGRKRRERKPVVVVVTAGKRAKRRDPPCVKSWWDRTGCGRGPQSGPANGRRQAGGKAQRFFVSKWR